MSMEGHDKNARYALFRTAIEGWVADRRENAELLSREQIGGLEGMERVVALRNGQLANVIAYCRANPQADATLAVLALITALSDNNQGAAYISAERLGEILSRARQNIMRALGALVDAGFLVAETRPGKPTLYTPAIHAAFAERANAVWFVDALSQPKAKAGRPSKKGVTDAGHHFGAEPAEKVSRSAEKGVMAEPKRCHVSHDTNSLKDLTKEDLANESSLRSASAPDGAKRAPGGRKPSGRLFEELDKPANPVPQANAATTTEAAADLTMLEAGHSWAQELAMVEAAVLSWGRKTDQPSRLTEETRKKVRGMIALALNAHRREHPAVVQAGFEQAMAAMAAKALDPEAIERRSWSSAISYFSTTLTAKIEAAKLAAAKLQAEVERQAIRTEGTAKREASYGSGKSKSAIFDEALETL
jgi:hypothetical protein